MKVPWAAGGMLLAAMGGERSRGEHRAFWAAVAIGATLCVTSCGRRGEEPVADPSSAPGGQTEAQRQLAADATALPAFDVEAGAEDLRSAVSAALGSSKETPAPTCGPTHSYDYIASDILCDDGRSPFLGDLRAAMGTRSGSVGTGPSGHVIDLYEVPCPEGVKQIYVDMYDCDNASPTRSEFEIQSLMLGVLGGDTAPYIKRCQQEDAKRASGRISVLLQSCVTGMPGVLDVAGDRVAALKWLKEWCAGADGKAEDGAPERFVYLHNVIESELNLTMEANQGGKGDDDVREQLTRDFTAACKVERAAFERWRSTQSEPE